MVPNGVPPASLRRPANTASGGLQRMGTHRHSPNLQPAGNGCARAGPPARRSQHGLGRWQAVANGPAEDRMYGHASRLSRTSLPTPQPLQTTDSQKPVGRDGTRGRTEALSAEHAPNRHYHCPCGRVSAKCGRPSRGEWWGQGFGRRPGRRHPARFSERTDFCLCWAQIRQTSGEFQGAEDRWPLAPEAALGRRRAASRSVPPLDGGTTCSA